MLVDEVITTEPLTVAWKQRKKVGSHHKEIVLNQKTITVGKILFREFLNNCDLLFSVVITCGSSI